MKKPLALGIKMPPLKPQAINPERVTNPMPGDVDPEMQEESFPNFSVSGEAAARLAPLFEGGQEGKLELTVRLAGSEGGILDFEVISVDMEEEAAPDEEMTSDQAIDSFRASRAAGVEL